MSLVKLVNKRCPVGVSHVHCRGTRLKNNKPFCFLCDPRGDSVALSFERTCPFAVEKIKYILSENQKCALFLGFNYLQSKYQINIPVEIYLIIRDILLNGIVEEFKIKIDPKGINHMLKCRNCSKILIKYVNNFSCNRHILPRSNSFNSHYN